MKEIDFLPEWYKSDKRKHASYRVQCVILGGVFVIMTVWNFIASGSISHAEANLEQLVEGCVGLEDAARRYDELKDEISELEKKNSIIDKTDSRIDVSSVLGELSFLVKRPTVLRKVELISEKFKRSEPASMSNRAAGLVRAARAKAEREASLPLGDVKFKVIISGVAPKPSDVAALICDLEDSAYFFNVVPSFSRNTRIACKAETGSASEGAQGSGGIEVKASEFEISCYLANYRQE